MKTRTKVVYRDCSTGRLITRFDAARRDPGTWREETITVELDVGDVSQFGPHSGPVADEADG